MPGITYPVTGRSHLFSVPQLLQIMIVGKVSCKESYTLGNWVHFNATCVAILCVRQVVHHDDLDQKP